MRQVRRRRRPPGRPLAAVTAAVAIVVAACGGVPQPTSARRHHLAGVSSPAPSDGSGTLLTGERPALAAGDVTSLAAGQPFAARPDFRLRQSCGIRPCWLGLTAAPDPGSPSVTDHWPYEPGVGHPDGDYVHVVCQTDGPTVTDEDGQTSRVWDRVIVPTGRIMAQDVASLRPATEAVGEYAYASDLWLGDSGNHGIPC